MCYIAMIMQENVTSYIASLVSLKERNISEHAASGHYNGRCLLTCKNVSFSELLSKEIN